MLVDPSEAARNHQASTKVFATPVLVIASQVSTRLSIILQRNALLTAMTPLVREFLAACAEEVPPVARCGEVPPADCTPRAVEGRVFFDPLREAPSAVLDFVLSHRRPVAISSAMALVGPCEMRGPVIEASPPVAFTGFVPGFVGRVEDVPLSSGAQTCSVEQHLGSLWARRRLRWYSNSSRCPSPCDGPQCTGIELRGRHFAA